MAVKEEDRQKSQQVGFDLHLAKPIAAEDLIKSILKLAEKIKN
ncbi:MAG: hypothetical protein ACFBSE_20930 [Prochloraceae cyanobacterium]